MAKYGDLPATRGGDQAQGRLPRFCDLDDGGLEEVTSLGDDAAPVQAVGVKDTGTLVVRLLSQAADAIDALGGGTKGASEVNDAAALLEGIDPKDAVEAMLAVQMVTAHNAAMRSMRLASVDGQSPQATEANINRATKLMRTYTAQIEALNRHLSLIHI